MEARLVYITVSHKEEARSLACALLEKRWIACANIVDNATSLYWWEGALQQDDEVLLIAKTTEEHVSSVIEIVEEMHSYDCPCILVLPVLRGSSPYLAWLQQELARP